MALKAAQKQPRNAEEDKDELMTREIRNAATELLAVCNGDMKLALRYLEASYEANW